MRNLTCAFGLGLLLVAGSAAPAFAQGGTTPGAGQPYPTCTRDPKPDEVESARQKYIAGKVDYDEGRYESAIERFRDAYAKDCTKHDLLIIISRAYEQAQDRPEAIRALEEYLKRVPNSPEKSTYERRIVTLRDALEKEKQQKAAAAASTPANGGTTGPSAGGTTTPPNADKGGHTVPPWIVVGVGGAAIVAGAIVLVIAPELPTGCDTKTNLCQIIDPNTGKPKDPATLSKSEQTTLQDNQDKAGRHVGMTTGGLVAIIAGAGFVAGGLIWHFVEPTGPSSSASTTPRLTPALAPGYAGLSLGGSF